MWLFDMINEVKDVNSILNKWLWLSCNLFCIVSFIAPPCWGFHSDTPAPKILIRCYCTWGLRNVSFLFLAMFYLKPLFLQKTIQNWAWDMYVYLSMNILIVCSSFRKGKSQFVLTHWTACKSLGQCQWAHDKYE